MNGYQTIVFKERFTYPFNRISESYAAGVPFSFKILQHLIGGFCDLVSLQGKTARGVLCERFDIVSEKKTKKKIDSFQWIAFRKDKTVTFNNGDLQDKRKMKKGERIRVLAKDAGHYFDVTTAMDWKTILLPEEFIFVVAPNPVIESFPEPFPGIQESNDDWSGSGSRWRAPRYYNGIPVVGGKGNTVRTPSKEKRKPMIRLSLNSGPDKDLFYEVASFAVEET